MEGGKTTKCLRHLHSTSTTRRMDGREEGAGGLGVQVYNEIKCREEMSTNLFLFGRFAKNTRRSH